MARKDRMSDLSPQSKEIIAENMKERVYSTITLLAILSVMWEGADRHSVIGTIGGIVGSVVALWAATLISIRLSYRAVHEKPINRKNYVQAFFTSSGLLAPAIPPVIIVSISGITHWYSLKTALLASMFTGLLSLFFLSFFAGRKIYHNVFRQFMVSTLEMSVGVGVILLKLAVGE
jgi:hypothetical protein